jgi:hypothetical protein
LNQTGGGTQFESIYEDTRRFGYRRPTYYYPDLNDGPDVNARDFENDVIHGYTDRIANLANRATTEFGLAGRPQRDEALATYLGRIGALVTRERLQNPDYKFDF